MGRGPARSFEKPKNARTALARLITYLGKNKGLLILVVVFILLSTASSLAGSYFLKPLINDYIIPGDLPGLANALLILGGIYLVGILSSFFQNRLMVRIAQRTINTLRRDLFEKLQTLPLRYFDAHTHGELMSRFTNDVDNVQNALEQSFPQFVSNILSFIGSIVMMIVLSPTLFIVTAVVLVLMFIIMKEITGKSSKYFREQQRTLGMANGYIEEMISGLKVVKVFTHEEKAVSTFSQLNEEYRVAGTNANFYAGVVMPILNNLNNISYAATAMVGGILSVAGRFDLGSLAAFLQYSRQFGQPVVQITNQLNNVLAALAGAERVFEVMDQEPEEDNGIVTLVGVTKKQDGSMEVLEDDGRPSHWAWKYPQPDGTIQYVELKGDVRFHDVTFGYEPDQTVLKDISLYAKPGQKIAFVGSTGAGKTTVTNLINRFYDVEKGQITYDGIDIKLIKKADVRRSLGMVLQDTHLFTGTVMENLRYGRLDATDEECIEAAKQVSAHSFIKRLPQGYQTELSGDGTNLSQGQRQLLAIARAAVADPPVMILDEATSSIDTRTERLIEKGMDKLMEGRTVFVIAHRLSTVRNSNAIIVLEDGQIIERGDHDDLLEQKGRYYQLYTGQYQLT
ncbi:MAG TPA: multidrug ABC transporter ATP-binding protein [Anaerolineaceae bacterium]|nr:multidrug ABC transporter ATP-binding protein [Anaerolineaceae bacterium]